MAMLVVATALTFFLLRPPEQAEELKIATGAEGVVLDMTLAVAGDANAASHA